MHIEKLSKEELEEKTAEQLLSLYRSIRVSRPLFWGEEADQERQEYAKKVKAVLDNKPHVPNKEESKLLRRLQSETGKTEEEIRAIPKYCQMLSEAAESSEQPKHQKGFFTDQRKRIMKAACKVTGLAKEHPLTKLEFNKISERRNFGNTLKEKYNKNDKDYFEEHNIEYKSN